MRKIAVINQKGGDGKTTTSRNISEILSMKGNKVLVIDMDPQGNLTTSYGIAKKEVKTLLHVFNKEVDINEIVIKKSDKLHVIPNNIKMSRAGMRFAGHPNWAKLLKRAMRDLEERYDFVIMDCPPSLDFFAYNALNAGNEIVVTLQAEESSLEGIVDLMDTVEEIREDNEELKFTGVVITQYKGNTKLHSGFKEQLNNYFSDTMFDTVIRENIKVAEANQAHKCVVEYSPNSNGAKDYLSLTDEIIARG